MTPDSLVDSELLSFVASLIVVVGVIVVFGWFYSRSKMLGSGNDVINVIASRPLGARERLLLVEVADKQLLVGMTQSHVQTLHVFESPIVDASSKPGGRRFSRRLASVLKEIKR